MKQLEKLNYNNGRVVKFDVADDGLTISVKEACDGHFSQTFNKGGFGELIEELKVLHSRMKDERAIKDIKTSKDAKMTAEKSTGVATTDRMLIDAERHIEKLTHQLKEKECEIQEHVSRRQFYEQVVRNLTTFK
jgi:hypothetical protein